MAKPFAGAYRRGRGSRRAVAVLPTLV